MTNVPFEDEPISREEEALVKEALDSLARTGGVTHEQVLADLGLTLEDWERMEKKALSPPR